MQFIRIFLGVLVLTLPALAGQPVTGERGTAQQSAVINFTELARQQASAVQQPRSLHAPQRPAGKMRAAATGDRAPAVASEALALETTPAPSPPLALNFLALGDDGSTIPPDTMGAVGPNHVVTMLNSQVRIQNRSGSILSTVTLNSFWSSLSNPDTFDPHITYDPFNNRWIASTLADAETAAAAVLVGVSATSDPTGNWFLFRIDADAANASWADFDGLGFNKDWIVVTANIFRNGGGFVGVSVWAFDKADLYADGTGAFTRLEFVDNDPDFFSFSVIPAQMHDNSLATMYLVESWDDAAGQLRVSTITGPVGSEVLTAGTSFPTSAQTWAFFGGENFCPQFSSKAGIDAGDSRLQSCSYRNGSLWASHTTFVPATSPTRAVAQWWQFLPNGTVQQFGRVEDPSGNQFFAYPSIAVNANDDVLLGYSRFSRSQYASGNYAFRFGTDAPNTLRDDSVLRAGRAVYFQRAGADNRWGDYSATCVDPVNDLTFWTVQEYAENGNSWATWWGRVDPDPDAIKLALTSPADGISYPTNPGVVLSATNVDSGTTFDKVEFFADGTKVGEDMTTPYTAAWTGVADGTHQLQAIATAGSSTYTSAVALITVGDPASPVGVWETKLSGTAKGNAIVQFNEDYSLRGHGMLFGTFGLFNVTGTWSFNREHAVTATYNEILNGTNILSGSFTAKVSGGKKFSATVTPSGLKLKGIPRASITDISGNWLAEVKVGNADVMENYAITTSPFLNVFDVTGSVTGMIFETAKSQLNAFTETPPARTLTGKSKGTSLTLKGIDENLAVIKINATKQ